ncbi:MAG TPA: hypothetical protein VHS27_19980 [Gaiellales bacterium]|nr:hypothetical protein [Gaiellales bacterium]
MASYSAAHDQGLSFSLYYLTYALDSVADVFGSLAFLAAGLSILRTGDLPRRLGWVAIATAPFLLRLQADEQPVAEVELVEVEQIAIALAPRA